MSRGPGRVERIIEQAFVADGTKVWTVAELCQLIWPGLNHVEHKHRVSVRRAAHRVTERVGFQAMTSVQIRSTVLFVGPSAPSFAIRAVLSRENEALQRRCASARAERRGYGAILRRGVEHE